MLTIDYKYYWNTSEKLKVQNRKKENKRIKRRLILTYKEKKR